MVLLVGHQNFGILGQNVFFFLSKISKSPFFGYSLVVQGQIISVFGLNFGKDNFCSNVGLLNVQISKKNQFFVVQWHYVSVFGLNYRKVFFSNFLVFLRQYFGFLTSKFPKSQFFCQNFGLLTSKYVDIWSKLQWSQFFFHNVGLVTSNFWFFKRQNDRKINMLSKIWIFKDIKHQFLFKITEKSILFQHFVLLTSICWFSNIKISEKSVFVKISVFSRKNYVLIS